MAREVLQAFLEQVRSSCQQAGVCTQHDAVKQFNLAFLNKGNQGVLVLSGNMCYGGHAVAAANCLEKYQPSS